MTDQEIAAQQFGAELSLFVSSFIVSAIALTVFFFCSPFALADLFGSSVLHHLLFVFGSFAALTAGAVLNSRVAGIAIWCAEHLYRFATRDRSSWERLSRIQCAALWPLVLVFWLVVAPVYASINRMFRVENGPVSR